MLGFWGGGLRTLVTLSTISLVGYTVAANVTIVLSTCSNMFCVDGTHCRPWSAAAIRSPCCTQYAKNNANAQQAKKCRLFTEQMVMAAVQWLLELSHRCQ